MANKDDNGNRTDGKGREKTETDDVNRRQAAEVMVCDKQTALVCVCVLFILFCLF